MPSPKNSRMLAVERQKYILDVIQEYGTVSVTQICDHCGVSSVTARTDLDAMEREGSSTNSRRGSARDAARDSGGPGQRVHKNAHAQAIGRKAAELVRDGETILGVPQHDARIPTAWARSAASRLSPTMSTVSSTSSSSSRMPHPCARAASWAASTATSPAPWWPRHSLISTLTRCFSALTPLSQTLASLPSSSARPPQRPSSCAMRERPSSSWMPPRWGCPVFRALCRTNRRGYCHHGQGPRRHCGQCHGW